MKAVEHIITGTQTASTAVENRTKKEARAHGGERKSKRLNEKQHLNTASHLPPSLSLPLS